MEPRTKSFLMWSGIVCLCFFVIPFNLKGEDQQHLEMALRNYSKVFGKDYDEDRVQERLPHFKVANLEDLKTKALFAGNGMQWQFICVHLFAIEITAENRNA